MILALAAPTLAATLSGQVVDPDGAPIEGVTVVAYDTRLNYATATSAVDGTWSMSSLPAGRYRLRGLPADDAPWADRFGPDTWSFCDADVWTVGDHDVVDGAELELPLGGSLAGRLLDADGAPVAGADVLVYGTSTRTELVYRLTTTDADGRFTAVGLDSDPGDAEPFAVELAAEGFPDQFLGATYDDDAAATFDVTLGEPSDAGDHALLDGIVIGGTIYGPAGPVPSGTVYAYSSSQVMSVAIGADGAWSADGLPPGDVIFWASSDGLATTYYPDPEDPDDVGDRPSGSIPAPDEGGAYAGADLTMPVESTLTISFEGDAAFGEVAVLLYNDTFTVGRGGSLSDEGVFTIDALHDGDYQLYVYGSGAGYANDWLRGRDGEPQVVHVEGDTSLLGELTPAGRLEGTVTDDQGEPVYGAYVYAENVDGVVESVATDAAGTWAMDGLLSQGVRLKVAYVPVCPSDPGYVTTWYTDYGGALLEDDAWFVGVMTGSTVGGLDVVLARDFDHDAMGDAWEEANGLDPGRDDAAEDADADGYSNLEEYLLGTDPNDASDGPDGRCGGGCRGEGSAAALLLLAPALRRRRQRS